MVMPFPANPNPTPVMPLTARRETGSVTMRYSENIPDTYEIPFGNRWVVRDAKGVYVDHDQYRNDLLDRYPGLIIVED